MTRLLVRGARCLEGGRFGDARDLWLESGSIAPPAGAGAGAREIRLDGRFVLPALVNAHDVLDQSTLPPLGARPPYPSLYEWIRASERELERHASALAVPLADRLFLGGMRNLLAGTAAVLHHHADHRCLGRPDFPVRVQRRYGFAHAPGTTAALRRTYRSSDRRIPWIVRAAEGSDGALRSELDVLLAANVLRHNTVIAHGTALEPEDAVRLAAAGACLAWCPESDLRLYGRTAPLRAFRAAGVCVGLGSDGAATGARDLVSGLPVARHESGLDEAGLLDLATRGSAEVARLPLGGFEPGAPADLLATGSPDALLAGERAAVALLLVRGEAAYGERALMEAAGPVVPLTVDGQPRALAVAAGRRFASLLRRYPAAKAAAWLEGVAV